MLMDRNRKQLNRATVVAAAVITAGLIVVIAANCVARAYLDPHAVDYALMDEDLYGALAVAGGAILGIADSPGSYCAFHFGGRMSRPQVACFPAYLHQPPNRTMLHARLCRTRAGKLSKRLH